MKLLSSIIGAIISCFVFCNTYGQGTIKFPEDFFLAATEAPKGFELLPVDEEAKAEGLASNPGLVPIAGFGPDMYKGADIATMKQIMLTVYRDKDPEGMDIHIVAIEYKSAKDLDREVPKFSINQELKYFLRKDKYLVILSGDLMGSYKEAVDKIAAQLSARTGLQKLAVEDKSEVSQEPEAVPVSAE